MIPSFKSVRCEKSIDTFVIVKYPINPYLFIVLNVESELTCTSPEITVIITHTTVFKLMPTRWGSQTIGEQAQIIVLKVLDPWSHIQHIIFI